MATSKEAQKNKSFRFELRKTPVACTELFLFVQKINLWPTFQSFLFNYPVDIFGPNRNTPIQTDWPLAVGGGRR